MDRHGNGESRESSSAALGLPFPERLEKVASAQPRKVSEAGFDAKVLEGGITQETISAAVREVYQVLDTIDEGLLGRFSVRLANIVELANLSSIVGNVLALGIVKHCKGAFTRAGAHKFQDLRAARNGCENIEIKMALETNSPKGHLAEGKAGLYLVCRYVLGDKNGNYSVGQRGDVVWIWEIRLGHLEENDFSISNTDGDSGKTAVVKSESLKKMGVLYLDVRYIPFKRGEKWYRAHKV